MDFFVRVRCARAMRDRRIFMRTVIERERESARAHARFYCDHVFDSMGVSECLV